MEVLRPKMRREVIDTPQTAFNIAKQLKRAIRDSQNGAKYLAKKFSNENKILAKQLYNFADRYISYKEEGVQRQTAKTLARILYDNKKGLTGDCKHYTVLIGSILKAKNKPFVMRMISQNYYSKEPNHIYIVTYDKLGNEIVIDPCMFSLGSEARRNYKYDLKV